MPIQFAIRGEYIQLDQVLKATGLCTTGGAAHVAVEHGEVKVDGQLESRKRAKLRPGQKVEYKGETIELTAEDGSTNKG